MSGIAETQNIQVEKKNGFAVVTMDRPREMNALSEAMLSGLESVFTLLEGDDDVRAVILTGGKMVFCAGMDVKEMAALAEDEIDDYFKALANSLKKIYLFRKPVIAGVGGIALGGGFNVAVVCDWIIASEAAIFGHPELKFGLNPLFTPLSDRVGTAKAKEITMLGEPIGAKEALRIGLVNKVAPPERFMVEAEIMAGELAKRSPKALEAVKKISDVAPRMEKGAMLDFEYDVCARLFSRPERKLHMQKFLAELKQRKKE
ncbi:MAG: enoyl-CoA hydratase/isomerase family protein [Syntrophales bacterium]|jgi:enoyl-CoA hydratase/carnithine racemase|nr:enoyl-CoA hydratase/isomerase family protein [Syntrophales bacterium]